MHVAYQWVEAMTGEPGARLMSQQPAKSLQLFLILSIPISCPNSEPPGGFGEVFPVFHANF